MSARELSPSALDAFVEHVVAPLPGDEEQVLRVAEALEGVLLEHALRGNVVGQRARLEAVQAELPEGELDDVRQRPGREAAAVAGRVDPVPDVPHLQRTPDDVVHGDHPGDRVAVEDRPAPPTRIVGAGDARTLRLRGEERGLRRRLDRREELPVGRVQRRELLRVVGREEPDHAARLAAVRWAGKRARIHASSSGSRLYDRPLTLTKSSGSWS